MNKKNLTNLDYFGEYQYSQLFFSIFKYYDSYGGCKFEFSLILNYNGGFYWFCSYLNRSLVRNNSYDRFHSSFLTGVYLTY